MAPLYTINMEVPALGDSLSWDTNQCVCDITTVNPGGPFPQPNLDGHPVTEKRGAQGTTLVHACNAAVWAVSVAFLLVQLPKYLKLWKSQCSEGKQHFVSVVGDLWVCLRPGTNPNFLAVLVSHVYLVPDVVCGVLNKEPFLSPVWCRIYLVVGGEGKPEQFMTTCSCALGLVEKSLSGILFGLSCNLCVCMFQPVCSVCRRTCCCRTTPRGSTCRTDSLSSWTCRASCPWTCPVSSASLSGIKIANLSSKIGVWTESFIAKDEKCINFMWDNKWKAGKLCPEKILKLVFLHAFWEGVPMNPPRVGKELESRIISGCTPWHLGRFDSGTGIFAVADLEGHGGSGSRTPGNIYRYCLFGPLTCLILQSWKSGRPTNLGSIRPSRSWSPLPDKPQQVSVLCFSGALLVEGSMGIQTAVFQSGIQFSSEAASLIDFKTDVDFSEKLKMCLQMSRPGLQYK